ncbi:YCF48-related protein [Botrimarina hoheduenensis]|uniref:Ycf48-like protein n=1 Tax=Botrimarina hoheduenensis TaxID=2528000 RepID=A0A5C5WFI0_9BACT|nr:YCF48-related protein [Botrimarina hoheduenensis]TWT48839.1 Ycf48-like protein precursor [Botrimarina hoheduenensis]
MTPHLRLTAILAGCAVALLAASRLAIAAPTPTLDEVLAEDATLNAIEMIDALQGWAVGDRGVILATDNGGRTWSRQGAPIEGALQSVSFIDARRGWAVGGLVQPHTRVSIGVVLRTKDGGRTWSLLPQPTLPALSEVRFFDHQHGIAAGAGSSFSPSGVFITNDGGRSWNATTTDRTWRWNAADFVGTGAEQAALLVGARGAVGRLVASRVEAAATATDRRGYHGVRWSSQTEAWLVGDGALVRQSRDAGRTWRAPLSEPPETLADWFDWRAVEADGPHAWIAGAPGSIVLQTHDAGASWSHSNTGVTTPLCAICFVDQHNGWAVGEFGVVLATTDGGATWISQRGERRHAAVLSVVGAEEQIPAELIAATAIAGARRTVIASPLAPTESKLAADRSARMAEAARRLGVNALSLGWRLPLDQEESRLNERTLAELLASRIDGEAGELARREMFRLLAIYRPSVLTLPAATPQEFAGLADWLTETIGPMNSVPEARLAVLDEWGLTITPPLHVLRVGPSYGGIGPPPAGGGRFSTGDFVAALGQTSAQWCEDTRGVLGEQRLEAPAALEWSVLSGRPVTGRRGDLGDATGVPHGGPDRRPLAAPPTGQLDDLRRLAQRRRNLERLLATSQGDLSWSGQVVDLTAGLDPPAGAALLDQLARGYQATGRTDTAAETRFLLARRYPGEPLADAALVWLVRYYASTECGWTAIAQQAASSQGPAALLNVESATALSLPAPSSGGNLSLEDRRERARALERFLRSDRPALHADPSVRMAGAAAQRARGFGAEAQKTALLLANQSVDWGWLRAATAEQWLVDAKRLPPEKPIVSCGRTARRPLLDGVLSENCWKDADKIPLGDPQRGGATLRLVRDDAFLYLAIDAAIDAAIDSPPVSDESPRPRDADLRGFDRVHIRLDLDRDYTTAYELTVDCRGFTHDALWGDRHWRPDWFVARQADGAAWRIEAAVALASLTDPKELERAAWAVAVERIDPTGASTPWSTSTSPDSPDAFGLLVFP